MEWIIDHGDHRSCWESSCKRAPHRHTPALSTRPRCGIRRPHNHRQARRKQGCTVRFDGEREAALDEPKRLWMVAHLMREAIRRPSGGQSGGHQLPSDAIRGAICAICFAHDEVHGRAGGATGHEIRSRSRDALVACTRPRLWSVAFAVREQRVEQQHVRMQPTCHSHLCSSKFEEGQVMTS